MRAHHRKDQKSACSSEARHTAAFRPRSASSSGFLIPTVLPGLESRLELTYHGDSSGVVTQASLG
ncbi:hypothetical protein COY28_04050, partial [Candidatus Woesearchaeota archaeon CG_4_10_14_0_2_um_filter_57_5]